MCARRKVSDKKKFLFSDDFYSDLPANDMIHAVIVRSPFSYGKVTSIDFAPKTKIPEGYELFTYKDIPGKTQVNILGKDIPILCTGTIAYKGEPLALLVGEKKEVLEELKSSIKVQLDKTEIKASESKFSNAYNSLSVSLKDGSPIEESLTSLKKSLEDFSKPKEIIAKRKVTIGNTEEIFADEEKAAFIVEGTWKSQIPYYAHKETEGAVAQIKGGNLYISTPSQWVEQTVSTVEQVTAFSKDKIFLTKTKSFGETTACLYQNGILASLAAFAAVKTGKAVRLSLSRTEQEENIERASDISISHKTALDKNGLLTAMEVSICYDSGAYNPFASYILDRLSLAACGIYNCKNVKISAKAYKSHNPPSSQIISMLDSQAFFAVENQIQKIAEITGFSPVDLRQMNKAGGMQKHTEPFTFSFGRSSDAINAVVIRSDFKRKYTVSRLAEYGRNEGSDNLPYTPPFRGIALACAFEGSGYFGTEFEKSNISMHLSVTEDKKLLVHALPPSLSIKEIWTKIIQDSIEIEKRNILFTGEAAEELSKKKITTSSLPESLVGDVSIKSILLQKCVDSLKRKKIDGTPFSIKKSLPISRKKAWNQAEFSGTPFYNTAFGTCTVEVELDACTFREKIRKICVIIDGGKILHPKAAENIVHRAISRCLSSLVKDESLRCPSISVQFTQSEEEPKQIGGLIYSILPAAYASALSQAIAISVNEMPLKTDSLYEIRERYENSRRHVTGDAQ